MKKSVLFSLSLFFCLSGFVYSQGLNSIIALDASNVVAAGNQGKIFRTTNAGVSWAKYTIGSIDYKSAAAYGDDVWLSGSDGRVYKTSKINSPVNGYATGTTNSLNGITFTGLAVGYACADGGLVYKTTNGGFNWSLSNSGIPSVKLNAIHFKDSNYGLTVGDNGKIYLTDNGGGSWISINSGTTRNLLSVKVFETGSIITGEWGTILSVSGITVTPIISKTNSDIRGVSGTSLSDAHIVGGGGFIRNNKNSSTDFMNFEINPMMANLVAISYLDASTGYALSSLNDAIIKTTNGGTSWQLSGGAAMSVSYVQKLSSGGNAGIGNGLCPHPFDRNVLFVEYGRNIYRSGDRGETWTQIATIPGSLITSTSGAHSFFVSAADTNVFMTASESTPADRVVRSTDYGQTWSVILNMNFTSYGTPLEADHFNPSVWYFAPDGGGFWKSTNNGANFTEISGNYPFRSPCDISVSYFDANVIFLADGVTGSATGELFKSTNSGVNWLRVHQNPGSGSAVSEIPCIFNSPFDKNLMYITTWSGSLRFKSTDYGNTWFGIQSTSFSGWTGEICREDPTLVLTGNYGQNVSLSTNSGTSWTEYPMPSGGVGAGTFIGGRDYLVSQQAGGILKMKISYTVVTDINNQTLSTTIPAKYDLYQNYPNPFNPSTEIRYDIKDAGNVIMKVFSSAGKEVYTLVNGFKNAGSYSVNFNASTLSSGVYYYALETNGNIITKKMMLIK